MVFYVQSNLFLICISNVKEMNLRNVCDLCFFRFLSNWIHVGKCMKWKYKWFTNCISLKMSNFIHEFKWMKESYWLTFVRMIWWINVDRFISYQRFFILLRMELLHLKLCIIMKPMKWRFTCTYSQYTGIMRKWNGGWQSRSFFKFCVPLNL